MLISPWWVLIWNLDLAYLKHYWVYRQTELIWQPWLMMPSNLLLCQAAEQLEFAPLQQWSWMKTCVDGPAMWIKPNMGKLPMLLLNFWKGWSAKAVLVPAPSPMSMQGCWQWCFPAGIYAEAARYIMMSHCVHEKKATLVHAVTYRCFFAKHTSKACANPADIGKTAFHSAVTHLQWVLYQIAWCLCITWLYLYPLLWKTLQPVLWVRDHPHWAELDPVGYFPLCYPQQPRQQLLLSNLLASPSSWLL